MEITVSLFMKRSTRLCQQHPTPKDFKCYPLVVAGFITSLITSNIIAVKLVAFRLPFDTPFNLLVLPAGIIIFPISYIFGDILTEVYGYGRARQTIWIGFLCNLATVGAIWIAGLLPAAPFWTAGQAYHSVQEAEHAYHAILGFTPRLLVASFIAYLIGEFVNSFVLAKMKIATRGRWLWSRTISSTLAGQLADSSVFSILAFIGTIPGPALIQVIITGWLVKSLYEALATPLTYWIVGALKRLEQEDYYDIKTRFHPFLFWE